MASSILASASRPLARHLASEMGARPCQVMTFSNFLLAGTSRDSMPDRAMAKISSMPLTASMILKIGGGLGEVDVDVMGPKGPEGLGRVDHGAGAQDE